MQQNNIKPVMNNINKHFLHADYYQSMHAVYIDASYSIKGLIIDMSIIILYSSIFVKQSWELNRLFVCTTVMETEHRSLHTVTMMATKVSILLLDAAGQKT